MLHELLFALLGFVGEVIVEKDGTFCVKDGFDMLREGERDQVNRLAPLGWYYVQLGIKVSENDLSWSSSVEPQAYMTSMVQGFADLLQEYVGDISYLEQLVIAEGPIPLSQVLQHMQKYMLVFPKLHSMFEEIQRDRIQGCRILDYFYCYNTGVPVLQEVINRIVLRLRIVFLKQCFAWMIHGELDDPGLEFFVQAKENSTNNNTTNPTSSSSAALSNAHSPQNELLERVMRKLHQAKSTTETMFDSNNTTNQDQKNFDWTTSYTLSLDKIPGSHVSPRIAGKIVFAGKAVKLLQSSGLLAATNCTTTTTTSSTDRSLHVSAKSLGYASTEAYRYLSSGCHVDAPDDSSADTTIDPPAEQNHETNIHPDVNGTHRSAEGNDAHTRRAYQSYVESGGYTLEDSVLFTEQFSDILRHPDQAVELLEAAVERINDTISNRLWVLLRDSYGFLPFLRVVRSTYLLGRGELFQSLLDGVLALTHAPTPPGLEMDNILNWKVLRTSAKLVGLENDDSLNDLIKLRVNNADLTIRNFSLHRPDLLLIGSAVEVPLLGYDESSIEEARGVSVSVSGRGGAGAGVRVGQRTLIALCRPIASSSYEQFQHTWKHFLRKKVVVPSTTTAASGRAHTSTSGELAAAADDTHATQEGLDVDAMSDLEDDSIDGDTHPHPSHARACAAPESTPSNAANLASPIMKYCPGTIRLVDQKFVSRGFTWSTTFLCAWNEVRAQLTSNHAYFKTAAERVLPLNLNTSMHEGRTSFPPIGSGAVVVELGSVSCGLSGDRKAGSQSAAKAAGTISMGVKFYGLTLTAPGTSGVRNFARVFLRTGSARDGTSTSTTAGLHQQRHAQLSVGTAGHHNQYQYQQQQHDARTSFALDDSREYVFGDGIIDIDDNLRGLGFDSFIESSVSSTSAIRLEVEYARSLQQRGDSPTKSRGASFFSDTASVRSLDHRDGSSLYGMTDSLAGGNGGSSGSSGSGSVVYTLRARVCEASLAPTAASSPTRSFTSHATISAGSGAGRRWDLEAPLDLPVHVKCQGGQAFVSLDATGLVFPAARDDVARTTSSTAVSFSLQVLSLDFAGKGALSTYPVASASTFTRYPDTFVRIQTEVDRIRAWMHMKLQLAFPSMFRVIFDAEAVTCYERLFSAVMKVRVVAHALERLWIARSRLASDRACCQSRHSMHFFVSNLLYYLQVDVVDSEYSILQKEISTAADFQSVLRAHKTFTSNMLRLSLIDNTSVQEGIERILQICLRFIAVCRIQHELECETTADAEEARERNTSSSSHRMPSRALVAPPLYIPPEELGFIRKDFFAQVSLLFQLMRKVESRGFIFRLDFNNFLSNAAMMEAN